MTTDTPQNPSQELVQIIFVLGCHEIADYSNSEFPDWPVEDEYGRLHDEEFDGQKVNYGSPGTNFGLLVRPMSETEIQEFDVDDLPGDVYIVENKFYKRPEKL